MSSCRKLMYLALLVIVKCLVGGYRRLGGTLLTAYKTTRRHNTEDIIQHLQHGENFRSQKGALWITTFPSVFIGIDNS